MGKPKNKGTQELYRLTGAYGWAKAHGTPEDVQKAQAELAAYKIRTVIQEQSMHLEPRHRRELRDQLKAS